MANLRGGMAGNTIPREAEAILMVPSNNLGCVTTDEEKVTFVFVTRSFVTNM